MSAPPQIPGSTRPTQASGPDTRLGVVLRVVFFAGSVVIGLWVFGLLFSIF
jgi:hypothetical protein